MNINKDLFGRAFGVLLFSGFLAFHLWSVSQWWHVYNLVAMVNTTLITFTIIFFLAAYFIRTKAVSSSKGFAEKIYPLFCSLLPFLIFQGNQILETAIPNIRESVIFEIIFSFKEPQETIWITIGTAFLLVGNGVTLIGVFYLKRSFSIMVEAREVVYRGIYKFIRHPLYVGEMAATVGILVFRFSNVNIALTVTFIIAQVIRSRLEERKLLSVFPDYANYKKKTGAFFPKVFREKDN